MTDPRPDRIERLYARAEQKNEVRKAATVSRGPTSLVAVCLGVALVVGITAAVDLRRLQSPRGTSMAWVSAAVFGDCTAYRELSSTELDDAQCLELRERTEEQREDPQDVDIAVLEAADEGDRARSVVQVVIDEREERVELALRKRGGDWLVQTDGPVCEVLYCP